MTAMWQSSAREPVGVLYVANSEKIGGGNRVLMDLAAGIHRDRFSPVIVTPGEGTLAEWASERQISCAIVRDGDWEGRVGLLGRAARLVAAIAHRRVRIVHAMAPGCYRAAGLVGAWLDAVRVCHLGFPPEPGELEWSLRFGPESVVACYTQQAREVEETVRRAQPQCRVTPIPNGVDTSVFRPVPLGERHHRWRFGAAHVALIVGHLSDVKGHPVFLRAAARVASAIEDCAFVVLGGETIQPGFGVELERLATDLGIRPRVHFLGWRANVAEIMQAADVVVLPSLAEGLPIAILEAMACAKPVIATCINGVPEAVRPGVTGILVEPRDADALAAAMQQLFRNPATARHMGDAGRRAAEEQFSTGRFVSSVEAVYQSLLDRRDFYRCSAIVF